MTNPAIGGGFAFYAFGQPGPQGSKIRTRYGMRESSDKVAPWREAVKAAAPTIAAPLDGPLICRMIFTLPRPASARESDRQPYRTPDLSKLARATEDAITDSGLWADDARVARYEQLAKVWWPYDDESLPIPGVVVACKPAGSDADLYDDMKDWIEAQVAIIRTEMVTFDQVMLPYLHGADGRTVYDLYQAGQVAALEAGPAVD